jgi:chromosomal replication initiator protein
MNDPDRQIWDGMLAHLRRHHQALCRQWFEELEPLGVAAGALHLRALTVVHRDYLKRVCSEPFNDAARTVSGRLLSVKFLGPEDSAAGLNGTREVVATAAAEARPAQSVMEAKPSRLPEIPAGRPRQGREDSLIINPDNGFENFVVGPENRLAHAAAMAVANAPGRAYNPLFIHGGVGLGKTHLLQAICLRILQANPSATVYYLSCDGFLTQFMESVQSGEMSEFRHRFRDVEVLVIDDIHFLAKRDRSQEEFFHTFNSLYQSNKQIVLSSDAPPEDIPDLEDRLVSRFKWGLVAKMEPPCYETRVAIVKTKARLRGIQMPEDCACHISWQIDSNIRELEGAIVKVQMLASVENRPIDLELTRIALGDAARPSGAEPTIPAIIAIVTDFYRLRQAELLSKRRQRSVALPRQVCMYLARRHTRHSLEEIGLSFGGRDHTTVMHAVRTIEARRDKDQEFNLVVRNLEERLRPSRA